MGRGFYPGRNGRELARRHSRRFTLPYPRPLRPLQGLCEVATLSLMAARGACVPGRRSAGDFKRAHGQLSAAGVTALPRLTEGDSGQRRRMAQAGAPAWGPRADQKHSLLCPPPHRMSQCASSAALGQHGHARVLRAMIQPMRLDAARRLGPGLRGRHTFAELQALRKPLMDCR